MKKKCVFIILSTIILVCPAFAIDWYVRPAGGNYGAENGTSYADAWDGLGNVVWEGAGVVAGDTLYICGLHLRTRNNGDAKWERITVGVSGSSGNTIIIRGDYSGDAGEVWGAGIMNYNAWADEGGGVWSTTIHGGHYADWFFEDVTAGSWTALDKATDLADCQATAGSHWADSYNNGFTLYIHTSDGNDATGRIAGNREGYQFNFNGQSYFQFLNLGFYSLYHMFFDHGTTPPGYFTDVEFNGCDILYGDGNCLNFKDDSTNITVDNCDVGWCTASAFSWNESVAGGGHAPTNITIKNSEVHDVGTRVTSTDAHAIGAQGCSNILIENNEIYNSGTQVCFYLRTYDEIKDVIVRYNYVHDSHVLGGANGRGICFNLGGNQAIGAGTGNKIYGNIVTNCSDGIQSQFHDEVQIYNNTVYGANGDGAGRGYSYVVNRYDFQSKAIVKNNVSHSPTTGHIYFRSEAAEGTGYIISDNNDFYPSSGNQFHYDGDVGPSELTLAEWQALSKSGCTFDPNSITGDPAFVNAGGSYELDTDFQLQPDSPAIDTGVDVGLTQDYERNPIPLGFAPDIGAFEYTFGSNPLNANINASPTSGTAPLSVNFTGSASGGTSPYSYSWNFDDGGSSTAQNPSHAFTTAGSYTAILTVTDNESNQDSDTVVISVANPTNPLAASVSASPTSGTAPLSVNFTGSASGGTSPYSYSWNFGDGGSSSARNTSHTYNTAGNYIVILTVTDSNSNQDTDSLTINVSSAPLSTQLTLSSSTGPPAPENGGTTNPTPGNHSYPNGENVQISAIPNTDYRFSYWNGNVAPSAAYEDQTTIVMDSNKSISSIFCSRCGDVNGDLQVTPSDAQAAFDIYLGRMTDPSLCAQENADVNSNGTSTNPMITPGDAQAIFNTYLNIGTLPSDCSAKTRAANAMLASMQIQTFPENRLVIDNVHATFGEYIFVPIIVDTPSSVDAFGFDLLYPSDVLEFVALEKTEFTKDFDQVDANMIEIGVLRVGGFKSEPVMNDSPDVLITLVFKVTKQVVKPSFFTIIRTFDDLENASIINGVITGETERSMPIETDRNSRNRRREIKIY